MQQSLPLLSSEHVLYRFGLRLGVLLLMTALQAVLGYETAFFELVALFAGAVPSWPSSGENSRWLGR